MNNHWLETRNHCPACTSEEFKTVYESRFDQPPIKDYLIDFYSQRVEFKYLENAVYTLHECNNCGLIYQRDIPNMELMEKLYWEWIQPIQSLESHTQKMDLSDHAYNSQEILQIISYFNKKPSSLKFFDFGMGTGQWALLAKGFECQSYGAELATKLIERAKSNGINIVYWDEIPQHSFDFINTEQVFEHITNPLETLSHLKKSLNTNGILKISVPTANNIDQRLKSMDWMAPPDSKNSLNPVAPLEHINFFRRSSILKMAEKVGMHEIFIPIKTQLRYTTDWNSVKKTTKNLLRPVYRNILKKQNYILLQNTK